LLSQTDYVHVLSASILRFSGTVLNYSARFLHCSGSIPNTSGCFLRLSESVLKYTGTFLKFSEAFLRSSGSVLTLSDFNLHGTGTVLRTAEPFLPISEWTRTITVSLRKTPETVPASNLKPRTYQQTNRKLSAAMTTQLERHVKTFFNDLFMSVVA